MIPTIIKTDLITPLARIGSVTPVTAIPDALQSSQNFTPGQKFLALVGTRLPNGNSSVLIAGQTMQMHLPGNIVSGNKIELVLIAQEPHLKFLLQNNVPQDISKDTSNISITGRFLGLLIQDVAAKSSPSPLPVQVHTTPILTYPLTNNVEIPVLLQKGLSQSGLFYESHQAQWISGNKTIEQLQQEPQGKLSIASTATSAPINSETSIIHAQSLPLVQQQLAALETGHLMWRGEIWPEQKMEWDIAEHDSEDNTQEKDESASQWQTQLRLTLPKLGDVAATITFSSHAVNIKLHTAVTETAELLKNNQPPLTTAMISAGLNIKTVEVHVDAEE